MAQLKMYWFPGTPIRHFDLPEGYTVSNYQTEADKLAWVECCKNGLVGDDADAAAFDDAITRREEITLERDVFFIDYHGEHIGTTTAFVFPDDRMGDMHMVGIRSDFRGRGLGKHLCEITLQHLKDADIDFVSLTTDEWRKAAVKSYLNAGFLPVEYDLGMQRRWENELEAVGVDSVQMVYEDGTPYRTVCRKSKTTPLRLGAFDKTAADWISRYSEAYAETVLTDDLLDAGTDAVVFSQVPSDVSAVMDCLLAGKNVLAPAMPVSDALTEAVRKSGKMLGFIPDTPTDEDKATIGIYKDDKLQHLPFADGEYALYMFIEKLRGNRNADLTLYSVE